MDAIDDENFVKSVPIDGIAHLIKPKFVQRPVSRHEEPSQGFTFGQAPAFKADVNARFKVPVKNTLAVSLEENSTPPSAQVQTSPAARVSGTPVQGKHHPRSHGSASVSLTTYRSQSHDTIAR